MSTRRFTAPWVTILIVGGWLLGTPGRAQGPAARALPAGTLTIAPLPTGPDGQRPTVAAAPAALRRLLALRSTDDLQPLRTETDALGFTHTRYQQYYQGVKVEHGTVSLHARAGRAESWSGAVQLPPAGLRVQPALAEAAARKRALLAMGARRFMWQDPAEEAALRQRTGNPQATYFPTGELVVVSDFRQPEAIRPLVLAWKFNVYAVEPAGRANLYVDARSGEVVLRDDVIKHVGATGTFATRYLGSRASATDAFGGGFRLRESVHGKGVVTLNAQRTMSLAGAVDFIDNDNNWTAAEYNNANFDNAALDAHVGAQATQDYWTSFHGRDSYDNQGSVLYSYVHYGNRVDNAYWDGDEMLYGDGGGFFRPLTAVDVCGHEMGHAVCQTTAGLIYQNESGAMNEGFSDIWGACVEHHVDPTKQIWLIGEDITLGSPGYLRSMSDPNTGDQPNTYHGNLWYTGGADNGGVHTNSGVLNHWFYLVSVGGTGINDNGTSYNVTGISIQKAARIAYRAESVYLISTSVYADARKATLQAAVDLYGLGSAEVRAVAEAWRAVGLNGTAPTFAAMAPASGTIGALVTLSGTNFHTIYRVTFNGVPATVATINSTANVVVVVPPGATTGPVVITTTQGSATSAGVFTVTGSGTAPTVLSYSPAGGAPQGATVTITGTNFTGTTAVTFNGTTATFTVNSATQITATVPATATSGPLRVTTPGGTATAPTPFLVLPTISNLTPTSGTVGTVVTIGGTSLGDALSVKFNGVYATFTVVSATSITATVPMGATTGVVTVRTPSGTATSPLPFTLTPTIAISSFTPASGPVGTVVTVYGVGFTGATALTFNNTPATTFTVASDNEVWATVPVGATTGPIRITSPLGSATSATWFNVLIPGAPVVLSFTPTLGPVGQSVTISGTDLTNATAVRFNGTAAVIQSNTSSTIVTTVPAGATTGQISVTTALGTGVSANNFQVVVPPTNDLCSATLPVLTCGVPVRGSCLGAGTTGDPTNGCVTSIDGGGVFYRFVGTGASVTVNMCSAVTDYDAKMHVFSGTCSNLTCIGGDDDGCGAGSGSSVMFSSVAGTDYLIFISGWNGAQGNFEVVATCAAPPAPPTITNFTPAAGPIGSSVVVLGTGLTGATAVRFNGTPATYTVNSGGRISTAVPAGATTGVITVTTPLGTATSANPFTVTSGAPVLTTLTPSRGPVGTTVTLTGTNLLGATGVLFGTVPATSFSVNPAGTQLSAVVPNGAGYNQLRVTTAGGTALTTGFFCTQYVAGAAGAARCGTGSVTLTATGAPTTANRYAWYTVASGGTPIAGATGATFTTPSLSATTTYYVAVAPDVACEGIRVAVQATVNAAPAVTIGASGPTALCTGGSVTLTASGAGAYVWSTGATTASITVSAAGTYSVTGTNAGTCASAPVSQTVTVSAAPAAPTATGAGRCGPGAVTLTATGAPTGGQYRWYAAATGGTPLATGATYSPAGLSATTTYYVSATNAAGCESPRQAVTATINAVPTAAIAPGGPTTFCQGDSVVLTASGNGSFLWSTGATTPQLTVRTAGTYTVTVTGAGNCPAVSSPVTVTVTAPPAMPTITAAPQPSGIVVLTSSAAQGNQWYYNGVPIPGATGTSYAVTANAQSGSYTVQATGAAGCASAPSAPQSVVVTGLPDAAASATWQLWPNPARTAAQLSGAPAGAPLVLFDATGRRVLVLAADAAGTASLDLTNLPRGVYAVRVGTQVKRLVVE